MMQVDPLLQVPRLSQLFKKITIDENALTADHLKQKEKQHVTKTTNEFGANIKFNPPQVVNGLQELIKKFQKVCNFSNTFLTRCKVEREQIKQEVKQPPQEKSSQPPKPQVSLYWLRQECLRQCGVADLANNIIQILKTAKDDQHVQAQLFDLLGVERLELISTIIQNKKMLLTAGYQHELSQMGADKKKKGALGMLSIRTTKEIELEKKVRKEQRKIKVKQKEQQTGPGSSIQEWLNSKGQVYRPPVPSDKRAAVLQIFGDELPEKALQELPFETKRIVGEKYEEYHIPAMMPQKDDYPLIPITIFEEWARLAFKGVTHLNRVQSKVYHAAYKTNENLLICAPTGCGKTNVAMMTMLREIGQHFKDGVLRKEEFKIIYVAPMKALAQEMVSNFSKRLSPLGLKVREFTGDMQLTKREIQTTQVIVTTPEKWDVVTRKTPDPSLVMLVRLLIIDEVHLLNEDRGPVIEALVARTLRQVESSQSMIRIVGLSATLPNYQDVATFLRVNPSAGLFYFDNSYRPVPLAQQFIGITETNAQRSLELYNEICYKKVLQSVEQGNQVMVFVHSRKQTYLTAQELIKKAQEEGELELFQVEQDSYAIKEVDKSRNRELKQIFSYGFGIHHAGMLRQDRSLVEKLFAKGQIKVLCCTATLAWGVNLPAHTVIIKGTTVYNASQGSFVELDMLDVMQIFGRAGRPQYDTSGEGIIITSYKQLPRYLSLLNHALPIESQLQKNLANALNAEIVLGTVTNLREAMQWMSYTYLHLRMIKNPMVYGITYEELEKDPSLGGKRREFIESAAKRLDECRMIIYDEKSQLMTPTELGRIASHYYIDQETIFMINETLKRDMDESKILDLLSKCKEFEQLKARDDEIAELSELASHYCPVKVREASSTVQGKVNILIQAYISNARIRSFSLVSDSNYVTQSIGRVTKALFEIVLRRGWMSMADKLLTLTKCIDRRVWAYQNPLRQFFPIIPYPTIEKLEDSNADIDRLANMDPKEISELVRSKGMGEVIMTCIQQFPSLELKATVQPITRNILRVQLEITPTFNWNKKFHGEVEPWWIWVDDASSDRMWHSEYFLLKIDQAEETQVINFTIPIYDPRPKEMYIHAVSDRWVGAEAMTTIRLENIVLPESFPPNTDLLPLMPLPITALGDKMYEKLYKFTHFNPIQTQVFFNAYHTDTNILLGSPTGSGKTIVAELAILRLFNERPEQKVVYIGPMKALVRERLEDWQESFGKILGKKVVELTGDYTPDLKALMEADIVVTTPEKWDGISRNWKQREYVRQVGLMIMDEIHVLGEERGPVLEVIVSRMRYISWYKQQKIRMVGLSATLSNAKDVADWLGIEKKGLYNFRQSLRPVPLSVHIQGFPGKHYCPRMATMNKPTYSAILTYSKRKPVLVFVSSRRQTRLTALDLISFCASDENPYKFVRMGQDELKSKIQQIKDTNLKHTLAFGIGMHHAGLTAGDKAIVEELFVKDKIQVLVTTSTLAWGVNFPAHLVIIKGTEYYEPKLKRYVDYPIADVLQMMGRAGRPQFDTEGIACIFVEESKKLFYKKFLYEPFPVESSLPQVLHDHINAEIVTGTIGSTQDAMDYLTWTFMFRRLVQNPSYYGLESSSHSELNRWLSEKVSSIVEDLENAGCIVSTETNNQIKLEATRIGQIASFYYLSYKSVSNFCEKITPDSNLKQVLELLSEAKEYSELPVRHNEDKMNAELAQSVLWKLEDPDYESPHTKTYLLLQAHFSRIALPITDYITDTKTVLDQSIRIVQGYIDIAAHKGYLIPTLNLIACAQMMMQGRWIWSNSLTTLPHVDETVVNALREHKIISLPQLMETPHEKIKSILAKHLSSNQVNDICNVLNELPVIDVSINTMVQPSKEGDRVIQVQLTRQSKIPKKAYTPKYPKIKDESYYIIVANQQQELIALKRIILHKQSTNHLLIPAELCKSTSSFVLYFMSDCYIGLDQQYDFVIQ